MKNIKHFLDQESRTKKYKILVSNIKVVLINGIKNDKIQLFINLLQNLAKSLVARKSKK